MTDEQKKVVDQITNDTMVELYLASVENVARITLIGQQFIGPVCIRPSQKEHDILYGVIKMLVVNYGREESAHD